MWWMGIGGWIAARWRCYVPTSCATWCWWIAAGMRPQQGEALDIFVLPWKQVIDRAFYDPQHCPEYQRLYGGEFQEFGGPREPGRVMSMRLGFRPFMYDPALQVCWGRYVPPP